MLEIQNGILGTAKSIVCVSVFPCTAASLFHVAQIAFEVPLHCKTLWDGGGSAD